MVVVVGHEPEDPPSDPHRSPIISPQLPQSLTLPPQSHVPSLQALMTALKHADLALPIRPESATSSLQGRWPQGSALATLAAESRMLAPRETVARPRGILHNAFSDPGQNGSSKCGSLSLEVG